MMRSLLPLALAAVALLAAAPPRASTQTTPQQREQTAAEKSLVEGSRGAIIKTGVGAEYFDRHFRVERVVDRPGDRRVVWRFSFGGYEALVGDSVGFYTEGGRRFDTHSVAATLNKTSELTRTITRARAERVMRRCLGRFANPQVEYRAHGPDGAAALLLTAETLVVPPGVTASESREEREERAARDEARGREAAAQGRDVVGRSRRKGKRPVLLLGAVDLSTGRCTVGRGQVGPPVQPQRPARRGVR
jgi:hypothetical protein